MAFLIGLIVVSVIGIGAVFWLLKNDEESDETPTPLRPEALAVPDVSSDQKSAEPTAGEKSKPAAGLFTKLTALKRKTEKPVDETSSEPKSSKSLFKGMLNKLGRKKESAQEEIPQITPLPKLREYLSDEKKEDITPQETSETPASPTPPKPSLTENPPEAKTLSKEEEKDIEEEIDLSAQLNELKEKYQKLDALFNEKSTEFEKTKQSLDAELKNRKEFNKVKDLLEKELKDSKDKTRSVEVELNNAQTESESHKKRTAQLEEKAKKLEKDLLEKEDKIEDLTKGAQPSSETPKEAASPPKEKPPQKEESAPSPSQDEPAQADQPPSEPPPEKPAPIESPQKEAAPQPEKPQSNSQKQQKEKKEESGETEPSSNEPEQKGGFKLNLSINEETPEEQPQEKQFLKLQPDVLSSEPQKDTTAPEEKKEDSPTSDEKPNQDNNNTNGKDQT